MLQENSTITIQADIDDVSIDEKRPVRLLTITKFCEEVGQVFGGGSLKTAERLRKKGIYSAAVVVGMEAGEEVERPLYFEQNIEMARELILRDKMPATESKSPDNNRVDMLEKKVDKILELLGRV